MAGLELGLKDRHGEPVAEMLDAEASHRGSSSMEIELLRERARAAEQRLPLAMRRSRRCATTSAATGRCFGIQRVCQVWERSRSALYARRARAHHHRLGAAPARRGQVPRQSDAQCWRRPISLGPRSTAKAIARSDPGFGSWTGTEFTRTRVETARHAGARTALPAPRASGRREDPRREGHHPGAPDVMWGTDGVRVFTLDDGWGWIFAGTRSNTGTRSAWEARSAKSGAASRHSID